jgi:hypothetical protein
MTTQVAAHAGAEIAATPAHGLGMDFSAMGGDFHIPGFGFITEFVDSLAGQPNAPAAPKVTSYEHTPSFAPGAAAPSMRM